MKKKDLSISMLSANILSLAFALPAAVLYILLFTLRWDAARFDAGVQGFVNNILVFLAVFIFGILAHELIHAAAWSAAAHLPLKTIRFGFQIQTLTPYAHCPGPIPAAAYRLGALMPALILGLLPALIALFTGSGWLLVFGLIFTIAAGGDMLILWTLRRVPGHALVEDHPTRAGCYWLEDTP